ncbi:MAG: hypothetical protein HYU57_07895, partial [Micavibrio aeruginosavorus]|nr:hypothetical protein [Micavibrio aeruginosavorus]
MPFSTGLKRGLVAGLTLGATFFVPVNKSVSDGLWRENPLHVVTDRLLGKIRYLE